MRIPVLIALLTAVTGSPLLAQPDTPGDAGTVKPLAPLQHLTAATDTELWLLKQRSGNLAGSQYTIPGKIATLSYQRYLNSFRYPIPRQFTAQGGGASGTGSGTGMGTGQTTTP